MPLIKYAALPTARMSIFCSASGYRDLAIVDFSTHGHGLYNYGHLLRLQPLLEENTEKRIFSTHLTEAEIALGDTSRLFRGVKEAADAGYRHVLLLPSAIAAVLGLDLEGYAAELSAAFGISVFTVPAGLNDDFYKGREQFSLTMANLFCTKENARPRPVYNLLGGDPSWQARQNHAALASLLKERLGLSCNFDNLNSNTVEDWNRAGEAKLNIVTAKSALPAAEFFRKKYGIPYLRTGGLGKCVEDTFLQQTAKHFNISCHIQKDDGYDFVLLQMKNILAVNQPAFVCYGDTDKLSSIADLFRELEAPATYFCSHENGEEPYLSPDALIERYHSQNVILLSYDSVCRAFLRSVEIGQTGLAYHLQTPLYKPEFGILGAYRLLEKLSGLFF